MLQDVDSNLNYQMRVDGNPNDIFPGGDDQYVNFNLKKSVKKVGKAVSKAAPVRVISRSFKQVAKAAPIRNMATKATKLAKPLARVVSQPAKFVAKKTMGLKTDARNIGKGAKQAAKATVKATKQAAKFVVNKVAKGGLAPVRAAYLQMLKKNMSGQATDLMQMRKTQERNGVAMPGSPWAKVLDKWKNTFKGSESNFKKAIEQGAGKMSFDATLVSFSGADGVTYYQFVEEEGYSANGKKILKGVAIAAAPATMTAAFIFKTMGKIIGKNKKKTQAEQITDENIEQIAEETKPDIIEAVESDSQKPEEQLAQEDQQAEAELDSQVESEEAENDGSVIESEEEMGDEYVEDVDMPSDEMQSEDTESEVEYQDEPEEIEETEETEEMFPADGGVRPYKKWLFVGAGVLALIGLSMMFLKKKK